MSDFDASSRTLVASALVARAELVHALSIEHVYTVECFRRGERVWIERFKNLVVGAGRQKYLDATLAWPRRPGLLGSSRVRARETSMQRPRA
jgi:hypothetical protein